MPTAALAASRGAQEAFRPLKQRFVGADREERAKLQPNFAWFLATYPNDGLADLALVYLGLIAVDRGDVTAARKFAHGVAGQGGTTHDLGEILEGAILLRENDTSKALERFVPLVGKLIDPYARMLLDEYIVAAALGARRWYEAVAYMDLWLREAPEESAALVRGQVRRRLEAIPIEALELMLQAMRAERTKSGYGAEIRRALVVRLAAVALEQQDTGLARRLVESTASSQALGDAAEGLEELASSGGAATVDGRTIGLLVSTGQSQLGGPAAEVLAGLVDAIRLTGETSEHVRLTTRDERDTKRTELALLALASQGASILIAGLDPAQAEIAARFAVRTKIPVILLTPPSGAAPEPPAFVLGESSQNVSLALAAALVSGGARVTAPVGGAPPEGVSKITFAEAASCTAPPSQAGTSRFPVEAWRASRVDSLLLLGDAACAADAMSTVVSSKMNGLRVAVGLEAAEIAADAYRMPLLVATTGNFPLRRGDTSSPMAAFKRRHGRAPSFWAALGHDAAILARIAEKTLPQDKSEDASEVSARHRAVTDALSNAEGELWSTSARGFASKGAIARDLIVTEIK